MTPLLLNIIFCLVFFAVFFLSRKFFNKEEEYDGDSEWKEDILDTDINEEDTPL